LDFSGSLGVAIQIIDAAASKICKQLRGNFIDFAWVFPVLSGWLYKLSMRPHRGFVILLGKIISFFPWGGVSVLLKTD